MDIERKTNFSKGGLLLTEKQFDPKGREILAVVKKKNYSIRFVKNENAEKSLDGLSRAIAELLYEEAIKKGN
ncbi:hypothetical protein [Bacillus solitudinis]|uniref:hypothetical protein n=1 Tax=Bacillus solitudinis TaxID=2014074 RepID=UPI0012FD0D33|nr:hypothetical protein [Bacillus solitudinis]